MTGVEAGLQVLIAPDCYGDSMTAVAAADAIATGWRRARSADRLTLAPQSDGGPGFVGVLAGRAGGVRRSRVSGPLEEDVDAEWVYAADTATAYIECAQACGLALLGGPPTEQTAAAAHSRGVGQLVDAALRAGATTIVVGLGGSACTDGGRGLIDAFGGLRQARDELDGVALIAATDVEHPLLGPMGAARIFGPQKGADPATVEILEQRLTAWAAKLDALAGHPVSPLPGAGAAGGLGAALLALGGTRASGAAVIAEHTGLARDIAAADVIVTGEGRFDDQSLHGKVVSALADGARARGIPVIVLAGQVTLDPAALGEAGIAAAYSIADHAGSVRLAIDDAANQLAGLACRTASGLQPA
ncbi:glycerate kinase family protein [Candidatus Mycolicibacterium alkanivorans]|uniref:Glycerate kinase n=1 Tax=Candidatus Mycolicibacterium alkanivorans TaxID=2954114 RepID=A0ABS9YWV8_9MYCO|nr:glycerate kinase [Candidatus Mycolicibacterium alkanivorans]MCI4675382.1 glycerate kinase [Candidatus Mycolicibacterium alkanivorans]